MNEENLGFPILKFEQLTFSQGFVSIFVDVSCLVLTIVFMLQNVEKSVEITSFEGSHVEAFNNSIYKLFVVQGPHVQNLFSIYFFNIQSNISFGYFDIETDITRQFLKLSAPKIHSSLFDIQSGEYRFFSTGFLAFDALSVYSQIIDYSKSFESIAMHIVQSPKSFGIIVFKIKIISVFISVIALILYTIATLAFYDSGLRYEQILTIFSLTVSFFGSMPYSYFMMTSYILLIERIFMSLLSGSIPLFNFLLIYHFAGVNFDTYVYPLSVMYFLLNALNVISNDSHFLAYFFENNASVFYFYAWISVISKLIILILSLGILSQQMCCRRVGKRSIYLMYSALIIVNYGISSVQALNYMTNSYANPSISFVAEYLIPVLTILVYSDIHWPVKGINSMMSIDEEAGSTLDIIPNDDENSDNS